MARSVDQVRVLVAVAFLLVPALAGCSGPATAPTVPELDDAVPHCVGECKRIVDDSPARAWEPFLAVDPKDPEHIVIAHTEFIDGDVTSTRARVSVSEDAGASWETRVVPAGLDAEPTDPLGRNAQSGGSPAIVFLPDGTLVMSALAGNLVAVADIAPDMSNNVKASRGLTLYASRSTDGGHTWGDVRIVEAGEGAQAFDYDVGVNAGAVFKSNDKPWLTAGPAGTLLLVWTQHTQGHPDNGFSQEQANRLVFSSSEDGGLTWSPARIVDDAGSPTGASPVIGRDGAWRVVYVDLTSGRLRFAESHDRGETWDARTIGASWPNPVMRAQTLASGVERLLLVYGTGGEGRNGLHRTELTWSDDDGVTWAPPLVIDTPQGHGQQLADVAGASGDSAWVTFFDIEGAYYFGQHSRYLAVKVVDGVAGAPLVLDEDIDIAAWKLGRYMGLSVTPEGDAIAAWVTYKDGEYDLVWARITAGAGYAPGATDWALAQPGIPAGLDEPVTYEFTGHVNVPECYVGEPNPSLEQVARDHVTFEFEVPPNTRFINGTLAWTAGPTEETTGLDLVLLDSEGDAFDANAAGNPEISNFEIREGDQGTWTALVLNCENPPTDFTLNLELS